MPAQPTMLSEQQLIDAAKAPVLAYNEKNWEAVRATVAPDAIYDEIATQRKVQGVDEVIALWQGWATAFPDSRATFNTTIASGHMVVLEVRWQGTHQGLLHMPDAPIPATGKRIDIRACMVVELAGEKAKVQRHYFDIATLMQQIGVTA